MRIVLVPGYKSSPRQHFWPWAYDELTKRGHNVIAVELPNPEEPHCHEWVSAIDKAINRPAGDTIFIAHSLGCVSLLHYLEEAAMNGTPKSVILIAPPYKIGSEKFESFFNPPIDFDTAMWKGQGFEIIHAADDPNIPLDHAKKYERELQGMLHELETGGHFTTVNEIPLLLDLIDDRDTEPGESLEDDFEEIEIVV